MPDLAVPSCGEAGWTAAFDEVLATCQAHEVRAGPLACLNVPFEQPVSG